MANGYSDKLEIDRRDPDKGYSPDNCRWVTHSQNMQNVRKHSRKTSTQFKGVFLEKRTGKWVVCIRASGRRIYGGQFDTDVEAAKQYDELAMIHFGSYARLNFP